MDTNTTPLAADRPTDNNNLALWFTPEAIREHFETDPTDPLVGLTDSDLVAIGEECLSADMLYELYHNLLVDAVADWRQALD